MGSNPFQNLIFAFKDILKGQEDLTIINLYFGNYMPSDMMPWHYRLVWFFITTPVIILVLFISGLVSVGKNLLKLVNKSLDKKFTFLFS